jgi:hypothetical protein
MPSKLTINESSDEPMPTEYGGRIEKLDSGKTTGKASRRTVEEADTERKVPVVLGGSIKKITKRPSRDKRWFYDDRANPLHVRQWVYEVILGAAALVLLISFLVIVIVSVRHGKLDLQSFLGATGTFLGGLGIGYGYRAQRESKRRKLRSDGEEEQENNAGDDTTD